MSFSKKTESKKRKERHSKREKKNQQQQQQLTLESQIYRFSISNFPKQLSFFRSGFITFSLGTSTSVDQNPNSVEIDSPRDVGSGFPWKRSEHRNRNPIKFASNKRTIQKYAPISPGISQKTSSSLSSISSSSLLSNHRLSYRRGRHRRYRRHRRRFRRRR